MPRLILGFVGPMASGKGTCCKYLADRYGASTYRFSTILRDLLNRLHLEHTRHNLQQISTELRNVFGEDLLAKAIALDVQAAPSDIVAVDGVRRLADIRYLKPLDGFSLVAVNADGRIRYERIRERRENPDDERKTFADFVQEGKQEAERQIAEVVSRANFTVDNNGTMEELHRQLDNIVSKLT